jgi:UDP-glucose 4-epimerase
MSVVRIAERPMHRTAPLHLRTTPYQKSEPPLPEKPVHSCRAIRARRRINPRFFLAILVTGGAGYIGSHAARALRRAGYDVVLYDNLSTGFRRLAQGFELVEGDISDEARLKPVLARVDAVMHFAAHAYVGESVENPRKYFRNNVLGALSLLNAVLDAGIRRFVFSSTCAVYGIPGKIPITEQTPREPVNP